MDGWIGLKEANAALKRLPAFVKPDVQQTIDVSAFQLAAGASRRARRRTGTLANSIQWESRPRSLSAIVGVTPAGYYWRFLEYGTVKMPPSPFLRPAATALESDHRARMEQALEKALIQMERTARG